MMEYIWQVTINNEIKYYFTNEVKALNRVNKLGKIIKHRVSKDKHKIIVQDDLGFKINIVINKLCIDKE